MSIQQIPAPPFGEKQRALFVRDRFLDNRLAEVSMDELNNVYARLPGSGSARPVVVTAHLDTVFPLGTDLSLKQTRTKIYGPGIGDNALGVAGLFGLIWSMQNTSLPGDIWLVANAAEEGLGDLKGMITTVDLFKDQVLAYLVIEGMALGQIYHRALGVERYKIILKTNGGHSWVNFGSRSAINELAKFITSLEEISLPKKPRTTLNVGVISGGTSVNTIAGHAELELDLRSEDQQMLAYIVEQVKHKASEKQDEEVDVVIEKIGKRPAGELPSNHWLVELVRSCLKEHSIQASLAIGSTDANVPLSRGIPAVCLGLTTGSGAHTCNEYINLEPLEKGISCLVSVVSGIFEQTG